MTISYKVFLIRRHRIEIKAPRNFPFKNKNRYLVSHHSVCHLLLRVHASNIYSIIIIYGMRPFLQICFHVRIGHKNGTVDKFGRVWRHISIWKYRATCSLLCGENGNGIMKRLCTDEFPLNMCEMREATINISDFLVTGNAISTDKIRIAHIASRCSTATLFTHSQTSKWLVI